MKNHHKLLTFWRIIKAGAQNFVRNATLAIAAMAVMVITLSIILFSIIANATFSNEINKITDKIDVSVYLKDDISDEKRQEFINDVRKLENVNSVEYISKEDALESYKLSNANNPDLLLAISQTDNPLPASIRIKPHDTNKIEDIRQFLERPEIKEMQSDETSYSGDRKEAIDKISSATTFIGQAGIVGILFFTIISVLIIFNTIRMAIFNRREELQIMRLLGATTWFIRGPFVVESVLYGVISGLLSVVLLDSFLRIASQAFGVSDILDLAFARSLFSQNFWALLGMQVSIGALIGATSSIIATRRYLKFKTSK